MEPETIFPDAELVVISYLREEIPGLRVGNKLPIGAALENNLPYVLVTRTGGTVKYRKALDQPRMDVEVYSNSISSNYTTMSVVRSKLEAMKATAHSGAYVTNTVEVSGPYPLPDSNPDVVRRGVTYELTLRRE